MSALKVLHLLSCQKGFVGSSCFGWGVFMFLGVLSAKTARNAVFFWSCFSWKVSLVFGSLGTVLSVLGIRSLVFGSLGTVLSVLGIRFTKVWFDELVCPKPLLR